MQKTLLGEKIKKYSCIHCSWEGYDFVKDGEFEVCPKCGWVCYNEDEIENMVGCYPMLKKQVKKDES